jgi:hypothetical protein
MAKKKGTNYTKLGFKVLEWVRPVVYYGFIPVVILVGMRTEPRPRCASPRASFLAPREERKKNTLQNCARPAQHPGSPHHHLSVPDGPRRRRDRRRTASASRRGNAALRRIASQDTGDEKQHVLVC